MRASSFSLVAVVVVSGLPSCSQSPPAPAKVQRYALELVGNAHRSPVDGRPLYTERTLPRWRVRPAPRVSVQLHFHAGTSTQALPGRTYRMGEHAFIEADLPRPGRYRVEAQIGAAVVPGGTLEVRHAPRAHPGVLEANALHARGLEQEAEARWRALQTSDDPWERFVGYIGAGRRLRARDVSAALALWSDATRDAKLNAELPTAVTYLLTSVAHQERAAGLLEREAATIERMADLVESAPAPQLDLLVAYNRASSSMRLDLPVLALRQLQALWPRIEAQGDRHLMLFVREAWAMQLRRIGRPLEALATFEALARLPNGPVTSRLNASQERLGALALGPQPWTAADVAAEIRGILAAGGLPSHVSNSARAMLGYLALREGELGEARAWLDRVTGWEDTDLGWQASFARTARAELHWREGDDALAIRMLTALAQRLRRRHGRPTDLEIQARHLRARIRQQRGDRAEAAAELEALWADSRAVARRLDPIGSSFYLAMRRTLPLELSRARLEQSPDDVLRAAAPLAEALDAPWRKMEALASGLADSSIYPEMAEAQAKLRRLQLRGCEGLAPSERTACRDRLRAAAAAAEAAEVAFYRSLNSGAPLQARSMLETIQRRLADNEAFALTFGTEEDGQVFLLLSDAVVVSSGARPWAGLEPRLAEISRLHVAGPLDPTERGTDGVGPWGSRLSVVRRPLASEARRPTAWSSDALIVADAAGDLPHANRLAVETAASLGAVAHRKTAATRALVLRGLSRAPQPRLFFFGGHGELLGANASTTRLRLADADLKVQDILTNRLGARLVVLNGCHTGGGEAGFGTGLPDAFLLQGAEAVVATVRPVADAEAEAFVARFFAEGALKDPEAAFLATVRWSRGTKAQAWRHYRLWRR